MHFVTQNQILCQFVKQFSIKSIKLCISVSVSKKMKLNMLQKIDGTGTVSAIARFCLKHEWISRVGRRLRTCEDSRWSCAVSVPRPFDVPLVGAR